MSQSPPSSPQPQPPPPPPPSPPTAIPTGIPTTHHHHHHHHLTLSPPKKPPPVPWTHEETLNLIRAYQEKWYSLKRGQLKASQWEEVAVTVAARCGVDDPAASKSSTQCRHKMEKLRKRYRAEKLKFMNSSSWVYFPLMDHLERGPLPISAVAPVSAVAYTAASGADLESDEDLGRGFSRDLKNFDGFLKSGNGYRRDSGFDGGNLRKRNYWEAAAAAAVKEEEVEDEEEERGREGKRSFYDQSERNEGLLGELAAQMRGFAELFVKVERKKMEMMRETERFRMEMENKRLEMILVSQQKTVDMITKVFGSSQKKMKMMSQDL